jgi:hypothetical protein
MKPVIPNLLYRAARPGYSGGAKVPVGMGEVQSWIEAAQALGIGRRSLYRLLEK